MALRSKTFQKSVSLHSYFGMRRDFFQNNFIYPFLFWFKYSFIVKAAFSTSDKVFVTVLLQVHAFEFNLTKTDDTYQPILVWEGRIWVNWYNIARSKICLQQIYNTKIDIKSHLTEVIVEFFFIVGTLNFEILTEYLELTINPRNNFVSSVIF